jgi:hypothetical protein
MLRLLVRDPLSRRATFGSVECATSLTVPKSSPGGDEEWEEEEIPPEDEVEYGPIYPVGLPGSLSMGRNIHCAIQAGFGPIVRGARRCLIWSGPH